MSVAICSEFMGTIAGEYEGVPGPGGFAHTLTHTHTYTHKQKLIELKLIFGRVILQVI